MKGKDGCRIVESAQELVLACFSVLEVSKAIPVTDRAFL
jgi:hypothetical protein